MPNFRGPAPAAGDPPLYSRGEEIANSLTHGVGAALSLLGTGVLLFRAARQGTALHVASFAIYGTTLILLHLASTLYHALRPPRAKGVFRVLDHCSIYLLIAGTYTPFLLLSLWGRWGATLLITIWTLALAGIAFKSVFIGRFGRLSVVLYLLMGWLIVLAAREVWLKVPHGAVAYVAREKHARHRLLRLEATVSPCYLAPVRPRREHQSLFCRPAIPRPLLMI